MWRAIGTIFIIGETNNIGGPATKHAVTVQEAGTEVAFKIIGTIRQMLLLITQVNLQKIIYQLFSKNNY